MEGDIDYNELGSQPISSLLCISRGAHKSWDFTDDNAEVKIDCRVHKFSIRYDERCAPYLKKLGLYQFSRIEHVNTDPRLVSALVERWRPETNTFHLPIGETTVTLQDVSCLWSLSISCRVVIGDSDNGIYDLIERCFGAVKANQIIYTKRVRVDIQQVEGRIMLHNLRVNTDDLAENATELQIQRYTRAYIMDLFGSVLFPDCSGDSVPAMYLRFLEDLEPQIVPNWGVAALACLYRNLTNACLRKTKTIAGPILLLQHWSWARFNIARPKLKGARDALGGDDPEERPPYAIRWYKYRTYEENPARGGMKFYRASFEALRHDEVNWQPYRAVFALLPGRVQQDQQYWMVRVPLICFWIVAWHYPERVMRQFGLYQAIPPRAPHDYKQVLKKLNKVVHAGNSRGDWSLTHAPYTQQLIQPEIIMENRPYNQAEYLQYRRWFQQYGMYTIYVRGQIESGLHRPLPPPRDSVEVLGYVPGGFRLSRIGQRGIQRVKWVIKNLYKRGSKSLAKTLLKSHRDDALDADTLPEFRKALTDEGLSEDVDELEEEAGTSTDAPPCSTAGTSTAPPRHSMPEYDFYGPHGNFTQLGLGSSQPSVSMPGVGYGYGYGGFGQFGPGASGSSQPGSDYGYAYGGYGQFATGAFRPPQAGGYGYVYGYGGQGQFGTGAMRPPQPPSSYGCGGFGQYATGPSGFAHVPSGSQHPNYDLGSSQPTQTSVNPTYVDSFLNLSPQPEVTASTTASLWMSLTGTPVQPTVSTEIPFTPHQSGSERVATTSEGGTTVTRTPLEAREKSSEKGRGCRKKKQKLPYTPSTPPPHSPDSRNTA